MAALTVLIDIILHLTLDCFRLARLVYLLSRSSQMWSCELIYLSIIFNFRKHIRKR